MKLTVRNNFFETNSSSVHTLIYKNQELEPSELPINNKTGRIIGHLDTFGCEFDYNDQDMKLSYLLTTLYYLEGYDLERMIESWDFRELEDALIEYTGCAGLEVADYGDPYIDHQSVPYYGDTIVPWRKQDMLNFIFNKDIVLHSEYD